MAQGIRGMFAARARRAAWGQPEGESDASEAILRALGVAPEPPEVLGLRAYITGLAGQPRVGEAARPSETVPGASGMTRPAPPPMGLRAYMARQAGQASVDQDATAPNRRDEAGAPMPDPADAAQLDWGPPPTMPGRSATLQPATLGRAHWARPSPAPAPERFHPRRAADLVEGMRPMSYQVSDPGLLGRLEAMGSEARTDARPPHMARFPTGPSRQRPPGTSTDGFTSPNPFLTRFQRPRPHQRLENSPDPRGVRVIETPHPNAQGPRADVPQRAQAPVTNRPANDSPDGSVQPHQPAYPDAVPDLPASIEERAALVYRRLKDYHQWPDHRIAAAMGTLHQESKGFTPTIVNEETDALVLYSSQDLGGYGSKSGRRRTAAT